MFTCGYKDSYGGREKSRIFRKAVVAGHKCILSPATPLSTHCSIEVVQLSPGRCGLVGNSPQNGITLFSIAREKSVKSVTPLGRPNATISISSLAQDSFPHHAYHTSRYSTRSYKMDQQKQHTGGRSACHKLSCPMQLEFVMESVSNTRPCNISKNSLLPSNEAAAQTVCAN